MCRRMTLPTAGRPAVTLLELLAVVAILGVLFGLTASAVQAARGAAARIGCANNLRQLTLASQHHHDALGVLPPGLSYPFDPRIPVGWPVALLPFLDQQPLWQATVAAYRADPFGWANPPHVGLSTVVPEFACPADGRVRQPITDPGGTTAAYLSYAGVGGGRRWTGGVVVGGRTFRLTDVTDGTSQTFLFGERPPWGEWYIGNWYNQSGPFEGPLGFGWSISLPTHNTWQGGSCQGPYVYGPGRVDNPCDTFHFWSLHPGGANWAFCDGSVRFLPYSARPLTVPLATRAGGEVVVLPD